MNKMKTINYNNDLFVRIECNNWYEIENGLIKACLRNGHSVILNKIYHDLWLSIGYGNTLKNLVIQNQNLSFKEICDLLQNLYEVELINLIAAENEFDTIFN